jgi:uncharacterized protein (TIGR02145 family)
MKITKAGTLILFTLALTLFAGCRKEEQPATPPVASFKITPANGLTTTTFVFDASASKGMNVSDSLLFIRWDWNDDDIWDTGFSRSRQFSHRYYVPGTYNPRMEIRNEAGLSDTAQIQVEVGRGYSAPKTAFTVTPLAGTVRTEFVFDAGATRDDEDSLNTIQFRWDWEGDGIFDTPYSSQTTATHMYSSASLYRPTVEAIDPEGLKASANKSVTVSINNTRLVPQFTWTPEKPTTSDTVLLDASSSFDPDNPGNTFTYRWKFTKAGDWETPYLTDPVFPHEFLTEGDNLVVLEIRDQWGLINQTMDTIFVAHSNLRPKASFFIGYPYGNLTTTFYFDANASTDTEDPAAWLKVRWDFESDGVWDTEFSTTKIANHKYPGAGTYHARVQVMDTGGATDTTGMNLEVSNGTNETGLIVDASNSIYYGTIKIGSQWWMAENLNEPGGKSCYSGQSSNCDIYGGLYKWPDAMNQAITEKARGLCPSGWHIPSVDEWQQLIDFYGGETAKNHLLVGGDSDFRMLMGGQRSTTGRSELLGQVTNFWTSTKSSGENAFTFSFQADQETYFKITLSQSYGFSVRCIKD